MSIESEQKNQNMQQIVEKIIIRINLMSDEEFNEKINQYKNDEIAIAIRNLTNNE